MQLAVREAEAGRFKEIKPEHLCMALLKFTEIREMRDPIIADELRLLTDALPKFGVESTAARRKLREALGKGGEREWTGQPTNSAETEAVFKAAAIAAKSSNITPLGLFTALMKSPSDIIARALLNKEIAALPTRPVPVVAVVLDKLLPGKGLLEKRGEDLVKKFVEGKLNKTPAYEMETKAVVSILCQSNRKSILLISNENAVMDGLSASLAAILADKNRAPALKSRRLLDVRESCSDSAPGNMSPLLTEASNKPEIILIIPRLKTGVLGAKAPMVQIIESHLERGALQFITTISPRDYENHLSANRIWKRNVQPVWFQSDLMKPIPTEL
jgi:ATP-dependent Clp protease ATP-binding subunit ClpA